MPPAVDADRGGSETRPIGFYVPVVAVFETGAVK